MTEKEILRYLSLIDRRLTILTSGISWEPEYENELTNIDQELAQLRILVDDVHSQGSI